MQTPENVIQDAIEKTGFGKFNLKITTLGALIFLNCALSNVSTGYILPAAACDFEMTTVDKGRIIIAPVFGSCIGSVLWGFLADLKGRRISLMVALFLQANAEILMSFASNYWALLFFKFLSGCSMMGEISILFTYVGEFQPIRFQKRVLSWVNFVMGIAIIILPLLAWVIIPLEFEYRNNYFFFRSWNLFVLICSLPAEILGIWLIFCPETPKYLGETGQTEKLMKVLTDMYTENIGGTPEEYIIKLANSGNADLLVLTNSWGNKSDSESHEPFKKRKLGSLLKEFKSQGQYALKAPYLKRLIIICVCFFCVASAFYSFFIWFPEIFQRLAYFEAHYPNKTVNICSISTKSSENINMDASCVREVDLSVYQSLLWQGIIALIPNILLPLLVDKLGFRFFAGIAVGVTTGLIFAISFMQNVVLSSIFLAVMDAAMSVMFSFVVVLFPTKIRVFASTISGFSSRLGTMFGNVAVTYLIDDKCIILIASVSIQLLLATALSLTLQA
ncbi:synaptic vesicle glycoprotein 2B-like isoform X2 [Belonocnema kinseyi]|uniref:synaptic vesicle glycoprotein 2B-like isoform X2 n=1 Tax=Belonocnema kinseyi TaxID=2817044 RepID=UPI00143DDAF1|nr:synaptic vesicle glycoprotein 2B-like isoform X2 [Belonocnema kinseyi]